ncbi:MAG: amidohydrolase family protein [Spirochaetes bacterium]|nr:amidohydrolase family protein [Spirochaetota bacterium]
MESLRNFFTGRMPRRSFILSAFGFIGALVLPSIFGCRRKEESVPTWPTGDMRRGPKAERVTVPGSAEGRLLLRKGLIVDGAGGRPYVGDLLVNGAVIEEVTPNELIFSGRSVDCSGKVIAPGFIDMHSHMDWVLPLSDQPGLSSPFTAQGVTTFVTGNCGFGVAGFLPRSRHRDFIETRMRGLTGMTRLEWDSMDQYFTLLKKQGITHNMMNLAGHGTSRMSIRGFDPTPLKKDEMKSLLGLLDESMEQGASGVSFGLQYEPGIFATDEEMLEIARLVKRRDGIVTIHMKAYSSLSPTYPLVPYGKEHNLLAIHEAIDLARKTGVRLQLSHLIFVGSRSWDTCGEALAIIDRARREGLDVQFDTYSYHCGTSIINVVLPAWFLGRVPEVYDDRKALLRLEAEFRVIKWLLGFGYEDIQITHAGTPELDEYNGMFLGDIAKKRKMGQFENFIDISKRSGGRARVLNHRYSNLENIFELMRHPASLFMTDAVVASEGVQNPGAFGNFPRFLMYARDKRIISLEEAVKKMTGASAGRFGMKKRGMLKKGYAADITVFDWQRVRDNNTDLQTDRTPDGIEAVFINGRQVLREGRVDGSLRAGTIM